MSVFLIHQEAPYAVLLADSLGQKPHIGGGASYQVTAPKLVRVDRGIYAAHAGTFQPAIDMLSEFHAVLEESPDWDSMTLKMQQIGQNVRTRYCEIFKTDSFDVRVALVVTGARRHPNDISQDISTSLIIWELARNFEPLHVTQDLHFAGSAPMTELATSFMALPLVAAMLKQGPLAAAHALVATHAALSKLSSTLSPEANVVVIGDDDEHTVLHGTLLELNQAKLIKG
jgi:hypothetical protein